MPGQARVGHGAVGIGERGDRVTARVEAVHTHEGAGGCGRGGEVELPDPARLHGHAQQPHRAGSVQADVFDCALRQPVVEPLPHPGTGRAAESAPPHAHCRAHVHGVGIERVDGHRISRRRDAIGVGVQSGGHPAAGAVEPPQRVLVRKCRRPGERDVERATETDQPPPARCAPCPLRRGCGAWAASCCPITWRRRWRKASRSASPSNSPRRSAR